MKFFSSLFATLVASIALGSAVALAQTPTFSATVTSGPAPISTVLTWNVPGALSCVAGNTPGWLGTVPISGTRTLTGIGIDMTLTLTCQFPGSAKLDWVPPTQNTDGTPLTNLAGYTVLYGPSASNLNQTIAVNNASAATYTVTALPAGSYAFAVRAKNSAGLESANSNTVTKAVVASQFAGSIPIDVTQIPAAPTGLVVTEITAFEIEMNPDGTLQAMEVELTPKSVTCDGSDCIVAATLKN